MGLIEYREDKDVEVVCLHPDLYWSGISEDGKWAVGLAGCGGRWTVIPDEAPRVGEALDIAMDEVERKLGWL